MFRLFCGQTLHITHIFHIHLLKYYNLTYNFEIISFCIFLHFIPLFLSLPIFFVSFFSRWVCLHLRIQLGVIGSAYVNSLWRKNYCFNEFSLLLLSRCFCYFHNLIIIKYENFHLFNILHEFYMIVYFERSSTPEKPIPIIWIDLFCSFIKFWYLLEHNSEKKTSHISTYSPNIIINVLEQKTI